MGFELGTHCTRVTRVPSMPPNNSGTYSLNAMHRVHWEFR